MRDWTGAHGVAMCLLPWLQELCAVPVLRTLTGDLLLQSTDGELRTLRPTALCARSLPCAPVSLVPHSFAQVIVSWCAGLNN